MYRMTARNIAIISPMRPGFTALSGAGAFAAAIIAKYSGTEAFPFSGETLIYFNALNRQLEEEKKLRDSMELTLRLMITRRLIVDGKLADITVTGQLIPAVTSNIERGLQYMRMTSSSAYTVALRAFTFINNSEEFSDSLSAPVIHEGSQSYRLYSVNMAALTSRIKGLTRNGDSGFPAYIYRDFPNITYKKEFIDASSKSEMSVLAGNTAESVTNTDYHYDFENLTYKTETSGTESTDVHNIQNVQNVQNVRNTDEHNVSAPVTNISEGSSLSTSDTTNITNAPDVSENVVNVANTDYHYDSENLTYKTETSETATTDVSNIQNVQNVRNTDEHNVSAPVTNISEGSSVSVSDVTNITDAPDVSENVVNVANTDYHYDSENLTYKTETGENSTTDVSSIQNVQNVQNVRNTDEHNVSAPVTNISEGSSVSVSDVTNITDAPDVSENVVNVANTDYHYDSENLTYKTETSVSETQETAGISSKPHSDSAPASAQGNSPITGNVPERVRDLAEIGLLVMNTFMSGGAEYISNIKTRNIHKRISLTPVVTAARTFYARDLLNSPQTSFGVITRAVGILTAERELAPYERGIYESSVTQVYRDVHGHTAPEAKQMLAAMTPSERTRVLTLVVNRLLQAGGGNIFPAQGNASAAVTRNIHNMQNVRNVNAPQSTQDISNYVTTLNIDTVQTARQDVFPGTAEHTASRQTDGITADTAWHAERGGGSVISNGGAHPETLSVNAPASEKLTVTEPETRLLRLLTEDKRGDIVRLIGTERGADTVSVLLERLYYGIPGSPGAFIREQTISDRVRGAMHLPGLPKDTGAVNIYSFPSLTELSQKTINSADYETIAQNIYNMREQRDTTAAPQSVNITNTSDITVSSPLLTRQETNNNSPTYAAVNNIGNTTFVRQYGVSAGYSPEHEIKYAERVSPVLRDTLRSRDIVKTVLERTAAYERMLKAVSERAETAAGEPAPIGSTQVQAYGGSPGTSLINVLSVKSGNADAPGYDDITYNFAYNTAVSEYELPITLRAENAVQDKLRLLPVYALPGVILPKRQTDISAVGRRGLKRAAAPSERSVITHRQQMTILKNGRFITAKTKPQTGMAAAAQPETENSMLTMMQGTPVLSYRDPGMAGAPAAPAAPVQTDYTPHLSQEDLISKFGNLIEGADAGLTPSFNFGTRGIGEAMAAIEQTAEKVELNTKLIEEIREKQRTIEEVTLKSTDIDAISEEMIRKLRSRMRLDRSRFTG